MAITYKHGVYSEFESSGLKSATKSLGTVPAYIGSLPIQRVNANGNASFDYSDYINKPILITSYRDVDSLNLYSDDWATYTLCEAIHAHFLNDNEVISPIILVNVLDPTNVAEVPITKTVTLTAEGTAKVGYIEDPLACLDTMAITIDSTELSEGEFSYAYVGDKVKIIITKTITSTSASVSYKQVEFNKDDVTADKMKLALAGLDMSEMITGHIPNIIAAPYFSTVPTLHAEMIQFAINKISDKWNTIVVSDIPATSDVNTIEKATAWKVANEYSNKLDKVCYPKVMKGSKVYHLSTLTAYTMQATDLDNDDVPSVSPSNKILNADSVILDDGSVFFMKESEANELNKVGITTVNIIQRQLRLWGANMANYNYNNLASIGFEDRTDCGIRTTLYLANMLQYDYIDNIDIPFSRKDIDSIKTSAQQRLNALVNEGKLLYATAEFIDEANTDEDIVNGDITFNVEFTLAPNAKSITFKLKYTDTGMSVLTTGEGAE